LPIIGAMTNSPVFTGQS